MNIMELNYEWLEIIHKKDIKDRTYLRYKGIIDQYINPKIGAYQISEITARELNLFISEIRNTKSRKYKTNNLSSSSINTIISVLKLVFNYAFDYELIDSNPMAKIKRLPCSTTKAIAFTKEEQIKLERFIEKENNNELFGIIFSLYTGVRIGELLALTWKDINLKTGIVSISKTFYRTKENGEWILKTSSPKSKSSNRLIPVPLFLKEILIFKKKNKKSLYIFVRNDGITQIDDKFLRNKLSSIEKKTHISKLNFHCLRHTFATRAIENKMDIKTLSEILGHSSCSITLNVYAHSLIDHKKQVMRKFKRLI